MTVASTERSRLLCIPGAGAAAGRFERMRPEFADLVELRTFELPGRGVRFAEPSLGRLTDHVDHFIARVEAEPYQRWIILGESLGALTAVRLAGELADSSVAHVVGVITVASAPGATARRSPQEVVRLLRGETGGRLGVWSSEGSAPAAATVIADIEAAQAVADHFTLTPLTVPSVTIRGSGDGLVDEASARRWGRLGSDRWYFEEVPGNHYLFEPPSEKTVTAVRSAIGFITGGVS